MSIECKKCGLVDDYHTIQKSNQDTCWCNGCGAFIKNLPQGNPPTLYFGKYSGRTISSLVSKEEVQYLNWLLGTQLKDVLRTQISTHLSSL